MFGTDTPFAELWRQCQERLQQELPSQEYSTWISPLQPGEDRRQNVLRLLAPNVFICGFVEDRYLPRIHETLRRLNSAPPLVQLEVCAPEPEPEASVPAVRESNGRFSVASAGRPPPPSFPAPSRPRSPQSNGGSSGVSSFTGAPSRPRSPQGNGRSAQTMINGQPVPVATRPLNSAYTMSRFVEGESNRMACAAAGAVIDHCGAPSHNPLVFYGGVGLGKTHLMHAVGNALLQKNPGVRVVYFSSEDFVNRLVSAIRLQAMDVFRAQYRDEVDVLLIDDVQFFADKDASETEAFNTIDTLSETGRQIVITCDRYPGDLGAMEARLRSRIGRGLSVPIEAPDLETRAAILMSKALNAGEPISEEIALFIARHVESNVRDLEGALNRVIARARFVMRPIDMDMTRRALADVIASSNRGPSIQDIKKRVANYYQVRVSDLDSPSRKASHVRPRQMAMHLARTLTRHSLPEIGEQFGGRDHTTALHACNRMMRLRSADAECETDYNRLHRELSE